MIHVKQLAQSLARGSCLGESNEQKKALFAETESPCLTQPAQGVSLRSWRAF